jgi:hypothetical protein
MKKIKNPYILKFESSGRNKNEKKKNLTRMTATKTLIKMTTNAILNRDKRVIQA